MLSALMLLLCVFITDVQVFGFVTQKLRNLGDAPKVDHCLSKE